MIGACCVMLWQFVGKDMGGQNDTTLSYSDRAEQRRSRQGQERHHRRHDGDGHYTNNDPFHTTIPANDPEMFYDLSRATA